MEGLTAKCIFTGIVQRQFFIFLYSEMEEGMATVLSMKHYWISGSYHPLSSRYLSVISGIAYFVGGIGALAITALFLFPFLLIFGCILKFMGV